MYPQPSSIRRVGKLRASFTFLILTLWFAAVGLQGCATFGTDSRQAQEDPKSRQIQASFLSVPLSFEANEGQTDSQVKFLSRGPGYGLFLTPTKAVLALRKAKATGTKQPELDTDSMPSESAVLRMRLVGANPSPELSGETALPGKVNYFKGNDPTKWRSNVPTYAQARYENVYPGIDLIYYGNQQQLEYDFVVAPGQDPASITMAFEGMERLELEASGDLVLQTSGGEIRQRKPVIYQEVAGERQAIDGSYLLKPDDQVSFQVAAYDATKPLIIDPILVFSTYLGGSGGDAGMGIAVDGAGQVYVTGSTGSTDFPTMNAFQPTWAGSEDAFVAQLSPDGTALNFSTYLGGNGFDGGRGIAVDGAGLVSVTGSTRSTDFPTANALQPALAGDSDAFVARLTADGATLVYSTYLGGSRGDQGSGIAVDGTGQAAVTGSTRSTDFPTANAFQPAYGGGFTDAFVAKLTADGTALAYATYLGGGGDNNDIGLGIAMDGAGQVSVTGLTGSTNFPTQNPVQPALAGDSDAFVARLTADGATLVYSTYLGGSRGDQGSGIAVDGAGQAAVTGITRSTDFPTQNAFQPAFGGFFDAFVAKLAADGTTLVYSTFLGGSSGDLGSGIAVDGAGQAAVTGTTDSTDFPTANAFQPAFGGGFTDAFVTMLTADGTAMAYSTYLGGSTDTDSPFGFTEGGFGIAVDGAGQLAVTGLTGSTDFPTQNALRPTYGGGVSDAFVAKIDPLRENLNDKFAPLGPGDVATAFSMTPCGGAAAGTFTITATFTNISADTLSNLLIAVQTLTGGNVLCNANGGPGRAGATLTVPLEGNLADGQLSPGESFVVELPVGLQSFNPFSFVVDVWGVEAP